MPRRDLLFFASLALLAGMAAPCSAAQFVVDSTDDFADASPGDGTCAAATGDCTLRAAILESNDNPGQDEIVLGGLTFTLSTGSDNEDRGFEGDLDILDDVILTGGGAVIDGGGIDRVLHVHAPSRLVATDLTIRGGFLTTTSAAADLSGGGLRIESGAVVNLTRVVVSGNAIMASDSLFGTLRGAGVTLEGGTLVLEECEISDNSATALNPTDTVLVQGGGVDMLAGRLTATSTAIVRNGTIIESLAADVFDAEARGGGITFTSGQASLTNVTISGNVSSIVGMDMGTGDLRARGGGVWTAAAFVEMANCTVADNETQAMGGNFTLTQAGGLFGGVSLKNSIVAENRADLGPDCTFESLTLGGHVLVGDTSDCEIEGDMTGALLDVEARLGPLMLNGGTTPNHLPDPISYTIDGGDAAGCADFADVMVDVDQRGSMRPVDGDVDGMPVCDMGAVEAPPCMGADADSDGVPNECDNCPNTSNPMQEDFNFDYVGDACACFGSPPLPEIVDGVTLSRTGSLLSVTWANTRNAFTYRVLRGPLSALEMAMYDHAADDVAGRGACEVAVGRSHTDVDDGDDGNDYYYIVMGVGECGDDGPTGNGNDGAAPYARDARVPTGSCP